MHFHKANIMLMAIMALIAMVLLLSAVTVLYQTAFEQTRGNLARTAISQARLLEAVAIFDQAYSSDFPEGSAAATLSQIDDAFQSIERIGKTGEFLLARRQGSNIEFLLISPGDGSRLPDSVALESRFAEPMRRALMGDSGTLVGPDYDGTTVLAAYQPVAVLELGIVVKIDLAEIRAPFLKTGGYLVLFAIVLTSLGSFLFFQISNPLIRRTEESEQRYERAVAGTNDGLWDWNIQTGENYFSPRWAEILEFDIDELKPAVETFIDLIHPDDKDRVESAIEAHLEHKVPYDIELRLRKKSGDYIWVQSRGRAVWDEDGQPICMAGSITDITERRKAEAALTESEERFRRVFDTIETGTMVIDTDGIIQKFNPAAEKIFGYKSDEAVGKNVLMLMPDPDRAWHDDYIQNYRRTSEAKMICTGRQVVGLRKNGEEFPMQLEVGEMQTNNQSCFVGSVTDLTELQSLEGQLRQSQKLEAVGQLTGGVAHDFNNLLAIIQGNLSLLWDDIDEGRKLGAEELQESIGPALQASKRGAELTHRLLAFSRKQPLEPKALDINAVAHGMEGLLRRTLSEDIDLKWHLGCADWLAKADATELENVLLNLVLNARDAMVGGGWLTIETGEVRLDDEYAGSHVEVTAGDYVMLAVSDTGTGMDAKILERVFEPFFTTKGVGKGTGLGLSMVYGFAKQSGGHVTIYSEPGEGTTVKLYLPRTTVTKADAPEMDYEALSVGGQETILVVEDDKDVRRTTLRILNRLGYSVLEAKDGHSAMEVLNDENHVDLLLTDVVLPGGMSGPDVARSVQEKTHAPKILYMSGYTENAILHHGRLDEGVNLIGKPYSHTELGAKVRQVLDSST